jgi:rhodanese-related sulfurtransferase
MDIQEILSQKLGTIVDVRTPEEFWGGNVEGSINIPLFEVISRLEEIKRLKQPLILCCASGNRSGQATAYLSQQNLEVYNAGSWFDVQYFIHQNAQNIC